MRHVAGTRNNFFNASSVVTDNLCLGGFEIHRTSHAALFEKSLVHVMQVEQVRHERLALSSLRSPCVGQNSRDFRVRKTCMAEHHGRVKLIGVNLTLGVDQHVTHHAQPLDIGVERTQAVGQFFGQHGDHAARKIHAGGPVVSIDVDRTASLDIVTHVGNGYQQAPAFASANLGWFAIHRVVKIPGVFTVNGHQRNIT